MLLANGDLRRKATVPGTARHFAVWHDPSRPSYLFALVGGRLAQVSDSFTTSPAARWRCTSMSSRARRTAAASPWTTSSTRHALDEEVFGRDYDLIFL